MGSGIGKPRVLAACPLSALRTVERVLGRHTELVFVSTLAGARDVLYANRDISMVVCSIQFDESRMYELLDYARSGFPQIPFVCVRMLDGDLSRIAADTIALAVETLGAAAYIDFAACVATDGRAMAEHVLTSIVLAHLHGYSERPRRGHEGAINR